MAKDRTGNDISPREAAIRLGIRLDALYALIWVGKIEARKREGRWCIPLSAVEDRLRARERSTPHAVTTRPPRTQAKEQEAHA